GTFDYGAWTIDKGTKVLELETGLSMGASLNGFTITSGVLYTKGHNINFMNSNMLSNNGTLRVQGTETLSFEKDTDHGTVEYVGSSGGGSPYSLTGCYGSTYYNLVINSSVAGATFQPGGVAIFVNNDLTVSDGTLSMGVRSLEINGNTLIEGGTLETGTNGITFGNNAADSVTMTGGQLSIEQLSTSAPDININAGTWNNTGGTISYKAGSAVTTNVLSSIGPYYNLEINSSGSTYSLQADTVVTNNLTITSGTLDVTSSNHKLTIGGDFNRVGAFTQRSGEVVFNDASRTSHIYGSTTFYDLSSTTAGKEIQVEAGKTETVSHTLTLTGTGGNLVKLRSASAGTQWKIDPTGTVNVSYVDVKDSNNLRSTVINPANSTDSGNNTNWFTQSNPSKPTDVEQRIPEPVNEMEETVGSPETVTQPAKPEDATPSITNEQSGETNGEQGTSGSQDDGYDKTRYDKKYAKGKYRTSVIVFEGVVVACPYGKNGPNYVDAQVLKGGDKFSQMAAIR
ncbi:MAG: hypothetical protein PHS37_10115, partial [Candidatus Omnitrophica bacterium]|nr:hypothetical protein [Candidatus Omnitrophota bacterium]